MFSISRLRTGAAVIFAALLLAIGYGPTNASAELLLNGAGATFPNFIYSKWFHEYIKVKPNLRFNYQPVGSGAGIRQTLARTVDFGASDSPMSDALLKEAPGEIFHIPMVMGAVVVTYNLPGNPELRFTPDILAGIFLGKITKWNDARIKEVNPGVSLPDKRIAVFHRSDGSGTTYIFTDYLSKVSAEWKRKVGRGKSIRWPVGLGGKGNEGVSGLVKQTPNSIGYVELAYAIKNHLPAPAIRNKAGKFVKASIQSTSEAAAGALATMPADFRVSLTNAAGAKSYPIASFTWILVYKNQPNEAKGKALVQFLEWAIHNGQKYCPDLFYAPLPKPVVNKVEQKLKQITFKGKPLL